jgi:DNA replication protein DnaC
MENESVVRAAMGRVKEARAARAARMTKEERAQYVKAYHATRELEAREQMLARYAAAGIPPRFYAADWDNWRPETPEQGAALDTVRVRAWNDNLLLSGGNGTGKTHLAMCLAKAGACYRRESDILREIKRDFAAEREILDKYGARRLLVIDEVGRVKDTTFEADTLFEIVDRRWGNVLPTTLLTNLTPAEFQTRYGRAIMDRLRPVVVTFDWPSFRARETAAEV